MDVELLRELARYQVWADAAHWKAFRENPALLEDAGIRKRLNHMTMAYEMLTTLARGEVPDFAAMKERDAMEPAEAAMTKAHEDLSAALGFVDPDRMLPMHRGPKGPFEAPAGVLLLQALLHSQYHRGQNASRVRELGVTPPMTDYVIWYALGRP